MSQSSIIRTIIGVLVLVAIILFVIWQVGKPDSEVPVDPRPVADILREQITTTRIITLDLIDFGTVKGWPEDGSQPYKLIGATTTGSPSKNSPVIGVLYVTENADETYPPGTYLVTLTEQGDPPAPSIQLVAQNQNVVPAVDVDTDTYEELGLEEGKNYFLYRQGSLRCDYCPSWLGGNICWCIRCQR